MKNRRFGLVILVLFAMMLFVVVGHAPSRGYVRNISFYDLPVLRKSAPTSISLHDAMGNAVTTQQEIGEDSIILWVAPGTDLTALSMSYVASVQDARLYENGMDVEGQIMDYSEGKMFRYSDGTVSREYQVEVKVQEQSETVLPSLDTARVRFNYAADTTKQAFFVTAFYDADGRFMRAVSQERSVAHGINVLCAEVQKYAPEGAHTAKLYLWDAPQGSIMIDMMK